MLTRNYVLFPLFWKREHCSRWKLQAIKLCLQHKVFLMRFSSAFAEFSMEIDFRETFIVYKTALRPRNSSLYLINALQSLQLLHSSKASE